jgi:hypothetical protein
MTRVLHIVSGNLYGGVETFVVTLARYRETCPAFDQQFAFCFDGRFVQELRAAGARVHEVGAVRVRQPISILKARKRLRDLINENRIDVVICHMAWAHTIFAPAVRSAGKSLVFWLHMATDGRHWLERWAKMTPPDLVMAPSRFVADTAATMFPRREASVVHYAVTPPAESLRAERSRVRAEFDTPDGAIVTIQACRLEEWKGQRIHLQALAHLRDVKGWQCWIVGGAQRPHELRRTARGRAANFGRRRYLLSAEHRSRGVARDIHGSVLRGTADSNFRPWRVLGNRRRDLRDSRAEWRQCGRRRKLAAIDR